MARYVDGFLIPIPKRNVVACRKMAALAGTVWKEHRANEYLECVGDVLRVRKAEPFALAARTKRAETVLFSFIVYRSRANRDCVNNRVMADPCITRMMNAKMSFDMKRMAYGGFKTIVDL
jgi:uncharacterized protein YbaA (DUF1428 family)